ncbi:DUF4241 domain-containing protein [Streptomyces virginiae]|uniref:DUF4241 domain-containing protein n=1 Tax=Streptomyces virginiae TaxID=1961 RepID=A0ABZ1TFJ9_STRVG|nr:DUF4241 domain-containing protein [Streptomyces virginiae]
MERGSGTVVEVGYAEGWDLATRTPWRPMSAEAARERDAAGLPYVAEHRIPGREAPLEVRLVSWQQHHVGLWIYDECGRRTHEVDYRLLEADRLLTRQTRIWAYAGPEVPEFDERASRTTVTLKPEGRARVSREPQGSKGGMSTTTAEITEDQRWLKRPDFGGWPVFSRKVHELTEPVNVCEAAGAHQGSDAEPADRWRAPRPGQPGPLDELFRPGTRMTTSYQPEMTVVEPVRSGTLNVPSGLLGIDCPLDGRGPRLTVAVPPGEYPLEEARISFGYDCMYDQRWVDRTETTAVRLCVSETPAASWEMAMAPEDDPRLLGEGEVYCFSTDGATGAFADAREWGALQQLFDRAMAGGDPDPDGADADPLSMFLVRTREPASGAELAAFAVSSDGGHPVWVGRSADGDVVGVVVLVDGMPALAAP